MQSCGALPVLVSCKDPRANFIRIGRLVDGAKSIEQMAVAARNEGYEYIGIADHSQSLKMRPAFPSRSLEANPVYRQPE